TVINPFASSSASAETTFTFAPTAHGGGYGDLAFQSGNAYISASHPAANPNTAPAVLQVTTTISSTGNTATVSPVLSGNASATDSVSGSAVGLNLQSPLSMFNDPLNDLILNDQTDSQLVVLHNPGAPDQTVSRTGLLSSSNPVQIGNMVFVSSPSGMLLVSDPGAVIVYDVTRPIFSPGKVYTTTPGMLAKVDLDTGDITPVVTGLSTPSRVAFIDNSNFRPTFTLSSPTFQAGGTILTIVQVNRQGPLTGTITVNAPNALPKGFKFVTNNPLVLSDGEAVVELKAKGNVPPGIYNIPFTATDSSGRTRNATLVIQIQ
ncbi:MAG TPA: hypothetical protein VEZ90_04315, partial [Blastocatellia bacterium]|nr:hypothetical protein [Blastocatellia bacterium]